jgi:hypothetical protein
MSNINHVFPNKSKRINKKYRFFGTALILVLAFFIIIVSLSLTRKTSPPVSEKKEVASFLKPADPWVYAGEKLTSVPEMPTATELFKLYQDARKAIADGDKEAMTEKLSAQLIWQSVNPLSYKGLENEILVSTKRNISTEEYFKEFLKYTPDPKKVTPLEVSRDPENTESNNQMIEILDEQTGKREKVIITSWRYTARLRAKTSGESQIKNEGYIVFVYDKGAWRYHAENWLAK